MPVKHWTPVRGTSFTAVAYGTRGFPGPHSPGPGHRGHNFFAGGPRGRTSGATQAVKIGAYLSLIRGGHAAFTLSGFLGGEGTRGDYATLTITWKSVHGQVLGHATIGPVTERQRRGCPGSSAGPGPDWCPGARRRRWSACAWCGPGRATSTASPTT